MSVSCTPLALLERSLDYALAGLSAVETSMLHRRTPCREWDLRDLLRHLTGSMLTLSELLGGSARELGGSGPVADATDTAVDFRRTVTSIDAGIIDSMATIGGLAIPRRTIVLTGALEVTLHGWDVGQVCERAGLMPAQLARDLLLRAALLLDSTDRRDLFADPLEAAPGATAAEKLLALAGR